MARRRRAHPEHGRLAVDIDAAKTHPDRAQWVKYRLRPSSAATDTLVYQSPAGHCFTDLLDHAETIDPEVDENALTPVLETYLREQLAGNRARTLEHVALVVRALADGGAQALQSSRVLDVGCGPGDFLAELRALGARVEGIELLDDRLLYARRTHGVTVHKRALGTPYWEQRAGTFDVVTLWDVLEHVDFPGKTLRDVAALLRPGGLVLLETPCRDGTFHRIGELTYRLSRGRYPTLLNLLYASHAFAHKQILALHEVEELLDQAGLRVERLEPIHQLALPTRNYLMKLLRAELPATLLAPVVGALLAVARPWNKARAIARKLG
jgi:2-polyprenyl-6-hydroxyphenyl methylase/3-demethylubiquinone-9 3-methyltransferase